MSHFVRSAPQSENIGMQNFIISQLYIIHWNDVASINEDYM